MVNMVGFRLALTAAGQFRSLHDLNFQQSIRELVEVDAQRSAQRVRKGFLPLKIDYRDL